MRLSASAADQIRETVRQMAGQSARVYLFGSRTDDHARGGDVDLLVEVDTPVEHPAMLGAEIAARLMRLLDGRDVDVVIAAPNLSHQPIHDVARSEGQRL